MKIDLIHVEMGTEPSFIEWGGGKGIRSLCVYVCMYAIKIIGCSCIFIVNLDYVSISSVVINYE